MGCLVESIYNLNDLNYCQTSLNGIEKLFVGEWRADLYKYLTITNNEITKINIPISFVELLINSNSSKFVEKYNFTSKKYDQQFEIDFSIYDYNKRSAVDSLIKSKSVFIFQNKNGKYFIIGDKNGMVGYETELGLENSGYNIKYKSSADYAALGVSKIYIDNMTADCSDLGDQNTGSIFFWKPYRDCIIPI